MSAVVYPAGLSAAERAMLDQADPTLRALALEHYDRLHRKGLRLQFNSVWRSPAQQAAVAADTANVGSRAELARRGLSGFAATAGRSKHELVDASGRPAAAAYDGEPVPKTDATWRTFGEEAEAVGLVWGGRWTRTLPSGEVVTDRPHVELPGSRAILATLAGTGLLAVALLVVSLLRQERKGGA